MRVSKSCLMRFPFFRSLGIILIGLLSITLLACIPSASGSLGEVSTTPKESKIDYIDITHVNLHSIRSAQLTHYQVGGDPIIIQLTEDQINDLCTLVNTTGWVICEGFWGIKLLPHYPEKSMLFTSENGDELLLNFIGTADPHGYIAIYLNPPEVNLHHWQELQNDDRLLLATIPIDEMDILTDYLEDMVGDYRN